MKRPSVAFALALLLDAAPALSQSAGPGSVAPARIDGTIARLKGAVLTVNTDTGSRDVTLTPNAVVRIVTPSTVQSIRTGAFVGATAEPQPNGDLEATRVTILSPAFSPQDLGEGFRFTASGTSVIATVTNVAAATAQGSAAELLTLAYPDGQKVVVVTAQTPVVSYTDANRSVLTPGTKVLISAATATGAGYTASSVTVGSNGIEPAPSP